MPENTTKAQFLELMQGEYNFTRMYQWAKNFMAGAPSFADMLGFTEAVQELSTPLHPDIDYAKTIDISGSGGSKLQTVNVGTIGSFILAAGGLIVAKQATRASTGLVGSRDLLRGLGIDIMNQTSDPRTVSQLLEDLGIAFYYHPSFTTKFANQMQFFTDLKEKQLAFVTPWHLLFWIYSPLPLKYRIYGMSTSKYLRKIARVFQKQGVYKGLVVCGGEMDEVSNTGLTEVVEFAPSKLEDVRLKPELFGAKVVLASAVEVASAEEAIYDAVRILFSQEKGPKKDLVVINCAAAFYCAGLTDSWEAGRQLSEDILASGSAAQKLEDYVKAAGEVNTFEAVKQRAYKLS
ncbi:MAG TPA: hypothetical protein VK963_00815 [Candidatus Saccharimonadales bacterium]|nr:hypothetical protein [Candidatus Saccharimonadales bacterium]